MRSLRDLLIFVLCGTGLIVWGAITALSPGAVEVSDAGSPYWTIPLGAAMIAAGVVLRRLSGRHRAPHRSSEQAAGPTAGTARERPRPAQDDTPPAP
ncbi:hypothetical protein [Streptomonospora litoralis]|uniref:Uncharacterized protein n=1 Tax=Streptomonospora litoralis TaxID=2498135 RepID=A0A4P6Q268_9ACTN|nr:hypothetical protein [Streptomonospora litoralis]QBI54726.1 hypothetical protein EKD16_14730 [Streptomonospora litoralis]